MDLRPSFQEPMKNWILLINTWVRLGVNPPQDSHVTTAGSLVSDPNQLSHKIPYLQELCEKEMPLTQEFSCIKLEGKHLVRPRTNTVWCQYACAMWSRRVTQTSLREERGNISFLLPFFTTFCWKQCRRKNVTLHQQYISLGILTEIFNHVHIKSLSNFTCYKLLVFGRQKWELLFPKKYCKVRVLGLKIFLYSRSNCSLQGISEEVINT